MPFCKQKILKMPPKNDIVVFVSLGVLGLLGLSGFVCTTLLYSILLLVNFSWIVSANGCRLVKPNHLNLAVLCDCLLFYYSAISLLHL
jgi:hypothetical protein